MSEQEVAIQCPKCLGSGKIKFEESVPTAENSIAYQQVKKIKTQYVQCRKCHGLGSVKIHLSMLQSLDGSSA